MKLCIATSSYPSEKQPFAGVFVKAFEEELKKQGVEVFVIDIADWADLEKPLSSLKLYNPSDFGKMLTIMGKFLPAKFGAFCRRVEVDHILAMWALPAGYWAMKSGLPYSVWCLGSDIWTYGRLPVTRWLVRRILRKAEHLFADGPSLAMEVKELSGQCCLFLPTTRRLTK